MTPDVQGDHDRLERPGSGGGAGDDPSAVVDMVYALDGVSLPGAHAAALASAIGEALPWLASVPTASIHPLRAAPTTGGEVLLARRARLVVRLPRSRIANARALEGRRLEVAGRTLVVGGGTPRALTAAPTLYAARVASLARDDRAFQEEVTAWVADLKVRCRPITGRCKKFMSGSMEIATWGLALHGLPPDDSIRLQGVGYGAYPLWGCGIFLPHKAITVAD